MSLRVRHATAKDAKVLASLIAEFDEVRLTESEMADRLAAIAGVETILLAEADGEVVGYAGLRLGPFISGDYPRAELSELYVQPARRRRGVGRALVEEAVARASEAGARRVLLLVSQGNADAQAFYRSLGFADCALAMRREIGPSFPAGKEGSGN